MNAWDVGNARKTWVAVVCGRVGCGEWVGRSGGWMSGVLGARGEWIVGSGW